MGGLADLMPQTHTTCVEISPLHCRVLEAKGHTVIEGDFLQWAEETRHRFDVVVMNPPYSEGRTLAHLNAAAALIKEGGRLGGILPAGADKKGLLPGWDCSWSEPMDGMFAGTGVRVMRLVAYSRSNGQKKAGCELCLIPPLVSTTKPGHQRNIDNREEINESAAQTLSLDNQAVNPEIIGTREPVRIGLIEEIAATAARTERPALVGGNTDCATVAAEALWIFARRTGLDRSGDEAYTAVQDLIANLMHLCEQEGITDENVTFASLVSMAEMHHRTAECYRAATAA